MLRHRGRNSGKKYATPIAVIPSDRNFFIALPWGRATDWVRNVLVAERCAIRGKPSTMSAPIPRSSTRRSH
ncbi:MAG: hypothetical protein M3400_06850 [Actinomycetota bacterium]|nr:hypothetical protein [Actinomycetota bacterium]